MYQAAPRLTYTNRKGVAVTTQLLDMDIRIDYANTTAERVMFFIGNEDLSFRGIFSLVSDRLITPHEDNEQEVLVDNGRPRLA